MQQVETRVLDDATDFRRYDRSAHFLEILKSIDVNLAGKNVADLGTGFGSLAFAAARAGATYTLAIDANPDRVDEVKRRAAEAHLEVDARVANLLLPLEDIPKMDVAFLVGVVEYAGLWDLSQPVETLQKRVIENAYRILSPGGMLVMATKNRLWPAFLIKDIHTEQPLVNGLPRPLADRFSNTISGTPYREHIHTPNHWKHMALDVGFRSVQTYFPYFSYQYPLHLSQRPSLSDYGNLNLGQLPADIRRVAGVRFPRLKTMIAASTATLGLPVTQSVMIHAIKTE